MYINWPFEKELLVTPGEALTIQLIDDRFTKYWINIADVTSVDFINQGNHLWFADIPTDLLTEYNNYGCQIWASKENVQNPSLEDRWYIGSFYIVTRQ